jgi:hypothetical protein
MTFHIDPTLIVDGRIRFSVAAEISIWWRQFANGNQIPVSDATNQIKGGINSAFPSSSQSLYSRLSKWFKPVPAGTKMKRQRQKLTDVACAVETADWFG